MPKNYILFQAYGTRQILAECRFALLQLLQHNNPDDFTVTIYTDDSSYFERELDLFDNKIIRIITAEEIKDWYGTINLGHRMKIKILQDFFVVNKDCNVIYFDTDTVCNQPLQPVFSKIQDGFFYMHTSEGRISERKNIDSKKWYHFLRKNDQAINDLQLEHPEETCMMNAGVIGMNSTKAPLLDQVLTITDTIYSIFPRHNAEQFAFSYVLQHSGKVLTAEKEVFHYWDLKEYRFFLEQFFRAAVGLSIDKQLQILQSCSPQYLREKKFKRKKQFFLLRPFQKKWDIEQYTNPVFKAVTEMNKS